MSAMRRESTGEQAYQTGSPRRLREMPQKNADDEAAVIAASRKMLLVKLDRLSEGSEDNLFAPLRELTDTMLDIIEHQIDCKLISDKLWSHVCLEEHCPVPQIKENAVKESARRPVKAEGALLAIFTKAEEY